MTVLTDVALAGVAFVLGVRLAYAAAAAGLGAPGMVALAMLATALTAVLGAAAHGLDPRTDRWQRERVWRAMLYASGFIGASSMASVAFFAARGAIRSAILIAAGLKLLAYLVRIARRHEFRVAVADYGGALGVLLLGAVYAAVRWQVPGALWLIAAVLVSLLAGLIQAHRIAFHRHFNHNDLYHVIEMVAVYLFYRGGALLVDR